jgi:HME family heavy-metal exporter
VPLVQVASIEESDEPDQIGRANSRRRSVIAANSDGSDMAAIIEQIRTVLANNPLADGYFVSLEGQFQAQKAASRLIASLALASQVLIFILPYSRYRSEVLAALVMGNIPLVLIGRVMAMWLAHMSLSVAALFGFITRTGIATGNGILKVSHYINLCKFVAERFGQAKPPGSFALC